MKDFSTIDSISLKAFYYSAKTLSFTRAAQLASLTQSGISQHIAKLETELESSLFIREKRQVKLTELGEILYLFSQNHIEQVKILFEKMNESKTSLSGLVKYAMPASCLKTPHFPLLLKNHKKSFKEIELHISLLDNNEILKKIVDLEVDFAFTTKKLKHKMIDFKYFASEEFVLVGSKKLINDVSEKTILNLPFITYPGFETLLEVYQTEKFSKSTEINNHNINHFGKINDLDGAITMCCHGLGLSIFPRHCVDEELKKKKLFIYAKGTSSPRGEIFLAYRNDIDHSQRVKRVIDAFWDMKS